MESDHITKRAYQFNVKIILVIIPDLCDTTFQLLFAFCSNPDNVA